MAKPRQPLTLNSSTGSDAERPAGTPARAVPHRGLVRSTDAKRPTPPWPRPPSSRASFNGRRRFSFQVLLFRFFFFAISILRRVVSVKAPERGRLEDGGRLGGTSPRQPGLDGWGRLLIFADCFHCQCLYTSRR